MPREFKRTDRVGDQIQRELAGLIQRELKDPRVGSMVSISEVRVASDMGYADVYVTLLSTEELNAKSVEIVQTLAGLNAAAGFLRNALGKSMQLRMTPHLRFHFDTVAGESRRLDALISKAVGKSPVITPNDDEVNS